MLLGELETKLKAVLENGDGKQLFGLTIVSEFTNKCHAIHKCIS